MGRRPKGMSQDQCRALWKQFMGTHFSRTPFRVHFNDATRAVYEGAFTWHPDGRPPETIGPVYLVLDEWHGDVEVCEHQLRRGLASHLGSLQLDADDNGIVSIGSYHSPPKVRHRFPFIGGGSR